LATGLWFIGWPHAHDNDPDVRYARTALLESVALNVSLHERNLQESARIGIHTGTAVIGDGGNNLADIFGDTLNIAARVRDALMRFGRNHPATGHLVRVFSLRIWELNIKGCRAGSII
jgi:class 3 adenylate cyclase